MKKTMPDSKLIPTVITVQQLSGSDATFEWTGIQSPHLDPANLYYCKLDNSDLHENCTVVGQDKGAKTYTALPDGEHTFECWVLNKFGDAGPPAVATWAVPA